MPLQINTRMTDSGSSTPKNNKNTNNTTSKSTNKSTTKVSAGKTKTPNLPKTHVKQNTPTITKGVSKQKGVTQQTDTHGGYKDTPKTEKKESKLQSWINESAKYQNNTHQSGSSLGNFGDIFTSDKNNETAYDKGKEEADRRTIEDFENTGKSYGHRATEVLESYLGGKTNVELKGFDDADQPIYETTFERKAYDINEKQKPKTKLSVGATIEGYDDFGNPIWGNTGIKVEKEESDLRGIDKLPSITLDTRTNQQADMDYVNSLATSVNDKQSELQGRLDQAKEDLRNRVITEEDYVNISKQIETEWNENYERAQELNNFQTLSPWEYYDWLKENGTEEDVRKFEAYVGSFDDSYLESLSNSYQATLVDFMARPFQAYDMVKQFVDASDYQTELVGFDDAGQPIYETKNNAFNVKGDETSFDARDKNNISTKMMDYANELRSYTLNGVNDGGIRSYSLQTISSLMPMINDAIIGNIAGTVVGASNLTNFASAFTNIEMGIGSANETFRRRLDEGNTVGTAFYNAVAHGVITGAVEAFNVGNVANITNLLSGGAGSLVLGDGLLALPKFAQMAYENHVNGKGEAVEEIAEYAVDNIVDRMMSAFFGEQINTEKSIFNAEAWGGIGDGGLTDQAIMAYAGAYLLGIPGNIQTTVDSYAKYKASGEARAFWQTAKEYFLTQNDTENATKCDGIVKFIDQERQTYFNNSSIKDAVETQADQVAPAPSIEETLNTLANAFKLDVDDNFQAYEGAVENLNNLRESVYTELNNRGYADMIDTDTYTSMTPEVRQGAKKVMDFAKQLGARLAITDQFDYETSKGELKHVDMNKAGGNGVAVFNDTIVLNPFSKEILNNEETMQSVFAHELTHTTELTGEYESLRDLVMEAIGNDYDNQYNKLAKQYDPSQIEKEMVANYIQKNFGNEKFLQQVSDYNSSAFTRIYTGMKSLLSADPNSKIAQSFFKAYDERINMAMTRRTFTDVFGDLISSNDCQFNLAQYKEKGKDILQKYLDKSVKNNTLTQEDANNIIETLDYYANIVEEMMNDPLEKFENFAQWNSVSMEPDHNGFPQLTCVVANGEYKMNIDFSTVCKKRKTADAVFNRLAEEGFLDKRALSDTDIAKLRQIVKDNGLEVACSLCFVDSKRFNQGGWAETLINGKEDKIDKDLVKLGVQDPKTKHIMGWNEMVDLLANDPSEIGDFNFAGRESVNEGTLHTLSDSEVNQKGLAMLKNIVKNTKANSAVGRKARALVNNPELRKHLLLGDLYGSTAFGNIKRGNQDFFKVVNTHQGVAKPKTPYVEVTYNNEIITSATFNPASAREVGGVRLQSFSDFMANMTFDYMEAIAEMQAKGLTAHSYTKVKEYAELFGQTGIKINLSIIPKALTITTKEFLSMSEEEKAEAKRYTGLERFTKEQVEEFKSTPEVVDGKETGRTMYEALTQDRGLGISEDGSCYTAYIFEDESFNWLDALELQSREGYDKNVGTICVGVSDEHIWKMMADDNVKMIIPYHKSSLNPIVAHMMNIGAYNDYTDYQNTRGLSAEGTWKSLGTLRRKDFNWYKSGMMTNGYDPKATSIKYLEWCAKKNYLPKFSQFAFIEQGEGMGDWAVDENGVYQHVGQGNGNLSVNENYYKVLVDFRSYDQAGNLAPQENVSQTYPSDFSDILKRTLSSYEDLTNLQKAKMNSVVEQVKEGISDDNEGLQFDLSEDSLAKREIVSPNSFDENGNQKPLRRQLEEMSADPSSFGFANVAIGNTLNFAGVDDQVLFINNKGLEHLLNHIDDAGEASLIIESIPKRSFLATDYQDKGGGTRKNVFVEYDGKPYLVSLKNTGFNRAGFTTTTIERIINIFDRSENFGDFLDKAISLNRNIYTNEKSKAYLERFLNSTEGVSKVLAYSNSISNSDEIVNNDGLEFNLSAEYGLNNLSDHVERERGWGGQDTKYSKLLANIEKRQERASEMLNELDENGNRKYSDSDIREATGFIISNRDGVPKFEFYDDGSINKIYDWQTRQKGTSKNFRDDSNNTQLRDILGDDSLFLIMYPHLADTYVVVTNTASTTEGSMYPSGMDRNGYMTGEAERIRIGRKVNRGWEYYPDPNGKYMYKNDPERKKYSRRKKIETLTENEIKNTIAHELQHAIQLYEGFYYGQNEKYMDRPGEIEAFEVGEAQVDPSKRRVDEYGRMLNGNIFEEENVTPEESAFETEEPLGETTESVEDILDSDAEDNASDLVSEGETEESEPLSPEEAQDNVLDTPLDELPIGTKTNGENLKGNGVAKVLKEMPEAKTSADKFKRAWRIAKHELVDHLDAVRELGRKYKGSRINQFADYAMLAPNMAGETIANKRFKLRTAEVIGESLNDIMGDLNEDQKQILGEYVYNWRNIDHLTINERTGGENKKGVFGESIGVDDSRQRIAEIEAENSWVKDRAERLWEFCNLNRQMLVDGGIISQAMSDRLASENPHYVPIQRNVDGSSGVPVTDPNKALKRYKGSDIDILPLEATLIKQTQNVYQSVLQNSLHNEIIDTLGNSEGIDADMIDEVLDQGGFNPLGEDTRGKRMFAYRDGKKYSIPISDDLYNSLSPRKNPWGLPNLTPVQKVSEFRRNLITGWNPLFMVSNATKDFQDAIFNTKYPKQFLGAYAEAWAQIATNGEFKQLYLANGGGQNSYINELGKAKTKGDNAFKKGLNAVVSANEAIELAPRLAEFIATLKDGKTIEEAMYNASEVTTNFKRGGDTAKYINRNGCAFLNASIQGFDKQIRNIQDAVDGGFKGILTYMAKVTLVGGMPLYLLNHLMWKDDDDYEELSDYVKENYYCIMKYGDGKFIRIPKGRIASFYQTVLQNGVDTLKGKTTMWEALLDDANSFMDNVAPNTPSENSLLKPLLDAKNNKTWYGEDLIPSRLQDVPDSEQFDETTDALSIALGKLSKEVADKTGMSILELSPYKVNYVLDQYSGAIGDILLPMMTQKTDVAIDNPILKGIASPWLDRFTTDSVLKNRNVSEFYSLRDEVNKLANSKNATDEQILASKYMYSVASEMGRLYGQKRAIQSDSTLTNKEKYNQVREIQKQINELAKTGLANYDQIDITGQYATIGGVQYYKKDDGSWVKPSKSNLEKLSNAGLSDEDKDAYYQTFGEITSIREDIKANTPEGQKADYNKATIDAISNSKLSAKGKNTLFDSYYDSKFTNHVNAMGLSDEESYALKVAGKMAEGQKDANGNTIANSKAEATAKAY